MTFDSTDPAAGRRARTPDELRATIARFSTPEAYERAVRFVPRPTDVFIATFSKSGTTVMQQIVHGLRTGGDMDFRDISEVVPWLDVAFDLGQDPDAEQRAEPRAFKSHFDRASLPRGGRVIYVVRDPEAVLLSFYDFFSGWFFEPEAMDLETFALDYFLSRTGSRDYWEHLVSWWSDVEAPDTLALVYEDAVADLAGTVRRVAEFIGCPRDEERLALATRQAEIDFMRRYPSLWEDARLREHRNAAMGLLPEAGGTKVRRTGDSAERRVQSDRVRAAWAERWHAVVAPVTGCEDYAALRRRLAGSSGP